MKILVSWNLKLLFTAYCRVRLCHIDLSFPPIADSDSDNFLSLKKSPTCKQNGLPKPAAAAGVKSQAKTPIKPSAAQSKTALKSPVTPKSVEPKKNPTSVVDYFGSGTIQRSDKKLVASAKRKAVSDSDKLLLLNMGIIQKGGIRDD